MTDLTRFVRVLVVGCLLVGCAYQQQSSAPQEDLHAAVSEVHTGDLGPKADQELGPTGDLERVQFSVSLRLPGAPEMEVYLAGLSTPGSASYRNFLAAAEFGERFGLSDAQIAPIVGWLESGGFEVELAPQRTSVAVSGSAAQVRSLLGVKLVDRLTSAGRRYHVPLGEAQVPSAIAGDVAAVLGLNTEPVIHPSTRPVDLRKGTGSGLTPDVVSRAYEIEALHNAGLHGEGMTIGIISFDTFTPSDVDLWDQRFANAGAPPVEIVRIPGAVDEIGEGTGEVALDIQVIRGIAPRAQIITYEGPNTNDGFVPTVARIVADGRAKIVSISWGLCENWSSPSAMRAEQQEIAAAFAAGISIFTSSGDDAAYDCRRVNISDDPFERDLSPGVDWPSASPNVISVGGTFLSIRQDGTYLEEAGWEAPLGGSGGGGGLSRYHDRPPWQAGVGVVNAQSNGKRQVPDVAGPADPDSGFEVTYTEADQGLVTGQVGGTSAAAPFFAASMLLTQQLAQQEGLAALGPLGPVLYQVAGAQPAGAVFHDVVRGGNLLYSAGPGWDYSTGLGTPRVAPLARAIVDSLKQ